MISVEDNKPRVLTKFVLPQNTDHAGVLWHGEYLRWMEEARIQALSEVGVRYADLVKLGFDLPVISLTINYKKSLKIGEKVLLQSWPCDFKGIRWPWITKFYREEKNLLLIAESKVELVLVEKKDKEFRIIRNPPDQIKYAMEKLTKGIVDVRL